MESVRRGTGNVGGRGGLEARAAGVAPDAAANDEAGAELVEVAGRGGGRERERAERRRKEEGRAEGGHLPCRRHGTSSSLGSGSEWSGVMGRRSLCGVWEGGGSISGSGHCVWT